MPTQIKDLISSCQHVFDRFLRFKKKKNGYKHLWKKLMQQETTNLRALALQM